MNGFKLNILLFLLIMNIIFVSVDAAPGNDDETDVEDAEEEDFCGYNETVFNERLEIFKESYEKCESGYGYRYYSQNRGWRCYASKSGYFIRDGWFYCSCSTNETACIKCPAGYETNSTGDGCDICQPGYYSSTEGSECERCSSSSISIVEGATECTLCPIGYEANTNRKECVKCSIGYYSPTEGSGCKRCPSGSISTVEGATECNLCRSGYG